MSLFTFYKVVPENLKLYMRLVLYFYWAKLPYVMSISVLTALCGFSYLPGRWMRELL